MTPEQRSAIVAAESALVAGNDSLTALSDAVRVLRASLTEGIEQISRALPGDRTIRWADWLRMNSAWRDNGHTGALMTQIQSSYYIGLFKHSEGYPVYSNNSGDQDPATDLAGGINLGFQHRNVSETASSWSCEVRDPKRLRTVDIKPKSSVFTTTVAAQTVSVPAASAWTTVSFSA